MIITGDKRLMQEYDEYGEAGGMDWVAYTGDPLEDVTSDSFIESVAKDFGLDKPGKAVRRFEKYDPTAEKFAIGEAQLKMETRDIETGQSVLDMYEQGQELRAASGFEGAGAFVDERAEEMLWDEYTVDKKADKTQLQKDIYDMRKKHSKEVFAQATKLKQMQESGSGGDDDFDFVKWAIGEKSMIAKFGSGLGKGLQDAAEWVFDKQISDGLKRLTNTAGLKRTVKRWTTPSKRTKRRFKNWNKPRKWKLSDVRVKENIEYIGDYLNILPVYEYNYVFGGDRELGFLAQDVEKIYPEVVSKNKDGFKMIHYGALENKMEKDYVNSKSR